MCKRPEPYKAMGMGGPLLEICVIGLEHPR